MVDIDTGFNCKWFLLEDPNMKALGNVRTDDLLSMFNKMLSYRKECFNRNVEKIAKYEKTSYTFGGCGSNPCAIIKLYKSIDED